MISSIFETRNPGATKCVARTCGRDTKYVVSSADASDVTACFGLCEECLRELILLGVSALAQTARDKLTEADHIRAVPERFQKQWAKNRERKARRSDKAQLAKSVTKCQENRAKTETFANVGD